MGGCLLYVCCFYIVLVRFQDALGGGLEQVVCIAKELFRVEVHEEATMVVCDGCVVKWFVPDSCDCWFQRRTYESVVDACAAA
jgi:hypothetical protein